MNSGNIGRNIKYYRTEAGLTQEELADKLGLSRQAISGYENGDRIPSDLPALARELNVTIDDLFADESAIPDKCRIDILLKKKHMSWLELSRKTGLPLGYLKAVQELRAPLPDDALQTVATELDCKPADLFTKDSIEFKTGDIAVQKEARSGVSIVIISIIILTVLFLINIIIDSFGLETGKALSSVLMILRIALLPVVIFGALKFAGVFHGATKITGDDYVRMNTEAMTAARKRTGLSVSSLSRKTGIPAGIIRKAEAGRIPLTMGPAIKYADAVGISADDMYM